MKSLEKVYTEGLKPMNFGQHDFDDDFDMYYRTQKTIRDFKYLSGSLYGDAKMIKCEILPEKKNSMIVLLHLKKLLILKPMKKD